MIRARPGRMKAAPPSRAPPTPRRRQAQKIAIWVEPGPGKQIGRGDRVLELLGAQPAAPGHAEVAEEGDVRGRSTKADRPDPSPLPDDLSSPSPGADEVIDDLPRTSRRLPPATAPYGAVS